MKSERHEKILEIINKYEVETQEELSAYLEMEGYFVTQATISRDIRELKLIKAAAKSGKQKYVTIGEKKAEVSPKYVRVFQDGFRSMEMAQNILVIKTVSGMAMAVAASLDAMDYEEMVGCIAGDDTVMCAIRTVPDTVSLMSRLRKLINGEGENHVT